MGAQQYDALAASEGFVQMLQAVEARDLRMRPVAGPAAEAHLDQRHAERLEMPRRQCIPFRRRQIGKTELDIASDDGAPAARKPLGNPAESPADRERGPVRQQAHQAQGGHAKPGRPVARCPETMKWLAIVAH